MPRKSAGSCRALALFTLGAMTLEALQLPEGPGRAEVEKLCRPCHEVARATAPRQDRAGWNHTMARMAAFGMKSSDQEFLLALDYLAKNFPAEDVPRINVNKASAVELESGLSLRRSQAASVLAYRAKHGDFKSLEDLKKVPLLEADKIEAKKDRIAF
jgi:competence protein ComEA